MVSKYPPPSPRAGRRLLPGPAGAEQQDGLTHGAALEVEEVRVPGKLHEVLAADEPRLVADPAHLGAVQLHLASNTAQWPPNTGRVLPPAAAA